MIYSLNGELIFYDSQSAVIECGGVGYRFMTTPKTLSVITAVKGPVFVYTHLSVKEDGVDLYGFSDPSELEMFKMLITVSGVGPKAALSVLGTYAPDRLSLVIAGEDTKALSAAPGIGNKTAQRIVLELKDKVGGVAGASPEAASVASIGGSSGGSTAEAVDALISLGFSRTDAALAVSSVDKALGTEEIIKSALGILSRQVRK